MKLRKSADELRFKFKVVATDFREPNAGWKGSSNGVEPILQR